MARGAQPREKRRSVRARPASTVLLHRLHEIITVASLMRDIGTVQRPRCRNGMPDGGGNANGGSRSTASPSSALSVPSLSFSPSFACSCLSFAARFSAGVSAAFGFLAAAFAAASSSNSLASAAFLICGSFTPADGLRAAAEPGVDPLMPPVALPLRSDGADMGVSVC